MPLAAVAKVLAQDARTLQVSVFDSALVPSVAKAIEDSPLQLNPEVHGKMLRVPVPRPTQACWYLTLAAGHGLPFGCPRALPHSRGPRRSRRHTCARLRAGGGGLSNGAVASRTSPAPAGAGPSPAPTIPTLVLRADTTG